MHPQPPLFGALFRIPFQQLNRAIEQGLIAAGFDDVGMAHFEIFRHIDADGSRSTVLAERAQITKQSVGYLVDHLERCGYVDRMPDPADRRAKLVRLTAKGRALDRRARDIIGDVEQTWAQQLGSEQMRELRRLLQLLIAQINNE